MFFSFLNIRLLFSHYTNANVSKNPTLESPYLNINKSKHLNATTATSMQNNEMSLFDNFVIRIHNNMAAVHNKMA